MIIVNQKEFRTGALLGVSFLAVLAIMFMPVFGGKNAFEASDRLFNSIAKGSTYFIPQVSKENEEYIGKQIDVTISLDNAEMVRRASRLFFNAGATVTEGEKNQLKVQGDLGKILQLTIQHADTVFHNHGDELAQQYGYHQKEILYAWHKSLRAMNKSLTKQENFKEAAWIEEVLKRTVEVAYNFFKIEPRSAASAAAPLSFALIFYVVYTMWWGYAILFMFEGVGLQMKAGRKKEV